VVVGANLAFIRWPWRLRARHALDSCNQCHWRLIYRLQQEPVYVFHLARDRSLFAGEPAKLILVTDRFYGVTENKREVEMDMREMVNKAKKGEPLYGKSQLSEYMQGVAARNSRYSGTFLHILPFANFVNHNQVSSPLDRVTVRTSFLN
jgi:hypothetical protein